MESRLWTVARFPAGVWSSGGKLSDPDYSLCELYQVAAESSEKATKKAQGIRTRLLKKGVQLPTQATPYKQD